MGAANEKKAVREPYRGERPKLCEHGDDAVNDGGVCVLCGKRIPGTNFVVEDHSSAFGYLNSMRKAQT